MSACSSRIGPRATFTSFAPRGNKARRRASSRWRVCGSAQHHHQDVAARQKTVERLLPMDTGDIAKRLGRTGPPADAKPLARQFMGSLCAKFAKTQNSHTKFVRGAGGMTCQRPSLWARSQCRDIAGVPQHGEQTKDASSSRHRGVRDAGERNGGQISRARSPSTPAPRLVIRSRLGKRAKKPSGGRQTSA